MDQLVEKNPDIVTRETIGRTIQEKNIHIVNISLPVIGHLWIIVQCFHWLMHQWMYKKERNLDMVTITQPTLADAEKPRDKAHSCSSDHKCDKLKSQIFWCSVKFKKNWTWMNMIGWSRGEKENSFGDGKIASRGKPGIVCRTGWDFSV